MSETIRLAALAGTLFVSAYGGVSWVMAGTPVPGMPLNMPVQLASLPTMPSLPALPSLLPSTTVSKPLPPAASAPVVQPRAVQQASLPAGDGNAQRDKLRVAALQASATYALTPCDEPAKAVMIAAVSSYAQAWADMMGCGPDGCDYKKINATAAAFSTPLDIQVRDAIGAAFDQRGISIDDFPSRLQINVAMLVRGRGAPATACTETQGQATR